MKKKAAVLRAGLNGRFKNGIFQYGRIRNGSAFAEIICYSVLKYVKLKIMLELGGV